MSLYDSFMLWLSELNNFFRGCSDYFDNNLCLISWWYLDKKESFLYKDLSWIGRLYGSYIL